MNKYIIGNLIFLALVLSGFAQTNRFKILTEAEVIALIAANSETPYLLNVKLYGAIGDGTNDDTDGIQATLDIASTNGGGIVWMPPGTYMVRSNSMGLYNGCLQLGSSNAPFTNVTIQGAGMDYTTIKIMTNAGANQSVIELNYAENITIRDLCLDGNYAARGLTSHLENEGLSIDYARNVTILNVRVKDTGADGFDVDHVDGFYGNNLEAIEAGGAGFGFGSSTNGIVSGLKAMFCGDHVPEEPDVAGLSALGSFNITFQNILLISNTPYNLQLIGVDTATIAGGVLRSRSSGTNIYVSAGTSQHITDLQVTSPGGGSPDLGLFLDYFVGIYPSVGTRVSDCYFNCRSAVVSQGSLDFHFINNKTMANSDVINLVASTNTIIDGNYLQGDLGVRLGNNNLNVTIRNNTFTNYVSGGIYSLSKDNFFSISGNRFNASAPSRSIGLLGTGTNVLISGNIIYKGDIELNQTNCIVENNILHGGLSLFGDTARGNFIRNNLIGGVGIDGGNQTRYNNQIWYGNVSASNTPPIMIGGLVAGIDMFPNAFYAPSISGSCLLTNMVMNGPTNATAPANTSTIKSWANFTNSAGGVFKMPLYQ